MKKFLITIFIFSMLLICTSSTYAQLKIAYIDIIKIREGFSDFTEAEQKFQKKMQVVQASIKSKETQLQSMEEDYKKQEMLLSEEKKMEKQQEMQQELMAYQQMVQEAQTNAQEIEAELLAPVHQKLKIAIEKVAKREGFDYVLDVSNTYYANEAYDITSQVLRVLPSIKLPGSGK